MRCNPETKSIVTIVRLISVVIHYHVLSLNSENSLSSVAVLSISYINSLSSAVVLFHDSFSTLYSVQTLQVLGLLQHSCYKSKTCQAWFTLGWKSTEWTRRWADLWNDLGFSLCAALSVCCVVATSDEGEKVWVGVSSDWCVAIEHWRSSSMRVYLCRLSD